MALQRFPLHASNTHKGAISWKTDKPIALMAFHGHNLSSAFTLDLSTGNSWGGPVMVDALGVSIGVSAGAGVQVTGEYVQLEAPEITFFGHVTEGDSNNSLSTAAAIQNTMDSLLFAVDNTNLDDIEKWVENQVAKLVKSKNGNQNVNSKITAKLSHLKDKARTAIKRLIYLLNRKQSNEPLETWTTAWDNSNKQPPNTIDLVDRIKALRGMVFADASTSQKDYTFFTDQLELYLQLLYRKRSSITIPPNAGSIVKGVDEIGSDIQCLNQLQLFGFSGQGKLGAGAGGGGSAGAGELNLEGKLEGSINADYQVRFVSYRFQSAIPGRATSGNGNTLNLTQDTWVSYRQAEIKAAAALGLGFLQQDYQVNGVEIDIYSYRSMNYCSVTRYWHPPHTKEFDKPTDVPMQNRSGFNYGMSVHFMRLFRCALAVKGKDSATCYDTLESKPKALISAISKQLRVTPDVIIKFLQDSKLVDDAGATTDEAAQKGYLPEVIFIESAYRFPDAQQMTVKKKKRTEQTFYYKPEGGFRDKKTNSGHDVRALLGDGVAPPSTHPLQSIRLRLRLADAVQDQLTVFKLGFPVGVVKGNIKITRIEAAGREAFFDDYVHWYEDDEYNTNPDKAKEAEENSVPPVVLFHL